MARKVEKSKINADKHIKQNQENAKFVEKSEVYKKEVKDFAEHVDYTVKVFKRIRNDQSKNFNLKVIAEFFDQAKAAKAPSCESSHNLNEFIKNKKAVEVAISELEATSNDLVVEATAVKEQYEELVLSRGIIHGLLPSRTVNQDTAFEEKCRNLNKELLVISEQIKEFNKLLNLHKKALGEFPYGDNKQNANSLYFNFVSRFRDKVDKEVSDLTEQDHERAKKYFVDDKLFLNIPNDQALKRFVKLKSEFETILSCKDKRTHFSDSFLIDYIGIVTPHRGLDSVGLLKALKVLAEGKGCDLTKISGRKEVAVEYIENKARELKIFGDKTWYNNFIHLLTFKNPNDEVMSPSEVDERIAAKYLDGRGFVIDLDVFQGLEVAVYNPLIFAEKFLTGPEEAYQKILELDKRDTENNTENLEEKEKIKEAPGRVQKITESLTKYFGRDQYKDKDSKKNQDDNQGNSWAAWNPLSYLSGKKEELPQEVTDEVSGAKAEAKHEALPGTQKMSTALILATDQNFFNKIDDGFQTGIDEFYVLSKTSCFKEAIAVNEKYSSCLIRAEEKGGAFGCSVHQLLFNDLVRFCTFVYPSAPIEDIENKIAEALENAQYIQYDSDTNTLKAHKDHNLFDLVATQLQIAAGGVEEAKLLLGDTDSVTAGDVQAVVEEL
ncbi:MAG: hypothetical protein KBC27_02040 [Rickettsiales bacterium]|nr:hypothetical protein [Rickettsiales bacterium]